jgi:hypothetical protein
MYLKLFNSLTDAIEQIEKQNFGQALDTLKCAQSGAEELYLNEETQEC